MKIYKEVYKKILKIIIYYTTIINKIYKIINIYINKIEIKIYNVTI